MNHPTTVDDILNVTVVIKVFLDSPFWAHFPLSIWQETNVRFRQLGGLELGFGGGLKTPI